MEDALAEIRELRESGGRASCRVVQLWNSHLSKSIHKFSNEKWIILEQVFIAALDTGNEKLARQCLEIMKKKFPVSNRVNHLCGMYLEFKCRYEEARALYSQIIEANPNDTVARKRLIAILKSEGRISNAIDELNLYLKIFMADFEAWGELCDLHLLQGNFKHAAFSIEEVILSNPYNHLLHQRLAEIKYTQGGTENLEISRSYFANACSLNPSNLRALFGLLLVTTILAGDKGVCLQPSDEFFALLPGSSLSNEHLTPDNCSLAIWASTRINALYKTAGMEALLPSNWLVTSTKQQYSPPHKKNV